MKNSGLRVTLAVVAASLSLCAPSFAAPIPFVGLTPLTPADSGTYIPDYSSSGFVAEFQTAEPIPADAAVSIEMTSELILGQDGTLADDKLIGRGTFTRRDSDPTKWSGAASTLALRYPGNTYYFQFLIRRYDNPFDDVVTCPPGTADSTYRCLFATQVFRFTVQKPQQPTPTQTTTAPPDSRPPPSGPLLSAASAKSAATRYAVKRLRARKARITCVRTDRLSFDCRAVWRKNGRKRVKALQVFREASGRTSVIAVD